MLARRETSRLALALSRESTSVSHDAGMCTTLPSTQAMTNSLFTTCKRHTTQTAFALVVGLLAVAWPSHAAYETSPSRQARSERRLLDDAIDGRLNRHSLVEAALLAGGTTPPKQLGKLVGRFEKLAYEVNNSLDTRQSIAERARAIHAFMHEYVLVNYRIDASDLAETLETGAYNCVSASVLFVALAERCGLDAHAVQLPEHVRCEVIADGVVLPIETTSLSAAVPSTSRHRVRVLTDVTLIATLYYNRGVAAFDGGDLQSAIDLNTIAVDLDPACRQARDNLLAAINNRVVQLVNANERTNALQLLDQGLQIDPEYRPFQVNRAYLQQNP